MSKKTLFKSFAITFALLLLTLTACTSKWDHSDPNMPEGLRTKHETELQTALDTLATTPDDAGAMFDAAFRYQMLGDYKNAVKYYDQILAKSENDTVVLNNIADIYEQMGNYDKAAEYIRRLYILDPAGIETIKDTVRILLEAGDAANAQEALDNFVSLTDQTDASMAQLVAELQVKITEEKE
jgi:tetratricopeptide (TPR) repeat protein